MDCNNAKTVNTNTGSFKQFFEIFDTFGSIKIGETEYVRPFPEIGMKVAEMGKHGTLKTSCDITLEMICTAFAAWIFHKNGRDEIPLDEFINGTSNLFNLDKPEAKIVIVPKNTEITGESK